MARDLSALAGRGRLGRPLVEQPVPPVIGQQRCPARSGHHGIDLVRVGMSSAHIRRPATMAPAALP